MKKKWVPVALAAFVVLDLVLVFLAIQRTSVPANDTSSGQPQRPTTQTTTRPTMEPSNAASESNAQPTASAGTTAPASNSGAPAVALLAMSPDGTVMRAESGLCSTESDSTLDISTDGGQSFTAATVPQHQILRVIARSPANLQYVGADESCEASLYQSVDGGQTWSEGPVGGAWHLVPGEPSQNLVAPGGPVEVGCAARAISVLDVYSAFVACSDGGVRGTADGGATWTQMGEPQGIVSVSFVNTSSAYALAVAESCPAEVRRTADGGQSWEQVSCIPAGEPLSIDAVGQRVIAVVGGEVHLSGDGGATWS